MQHTLHIYFKNFNNKFITPKSCLPDERRREMILNILLCGLALISVLASASTISNHLQGNAVGRTNSLVPLLAFTMFVFGLWWLSRQGYYKFGSYVLLGLLLTYATQLAVTWSFELPEAILTFATLIVVAGVLFTTRTALIVTFLVIMYLAVLSYLQTYGHLNPNTAWLNQDLELADGVGYIATLLVISLVSWLANREIFRSLQRARASEAALAAERDSLEVKVAERTQALEHAQLERVVELERLADFGKISAGLLHDVANPLTAASLNLEQLDNSGQSQLVSQAQQSLQYIERFINAARQQLQSQGEAVEFVVQDELEQVLNMLKFRARELDVKLSLDCARHCRWYGDPVKFNQITANLVLNAIEAYDQQPAKSKRLVQVVVARQADDLTLTVRDWGRGLDKEQHQHLFKPFYSTKATDQRNLGIGLSTVKQIVEQDFGGRITAASSARQGTRFSVHLKCVTEGVRRS